MAKKKSSNVQSESPKDSGAVISLILPNYAIFEGMDELLNISGKVITEYEPFEGLPTGSLSLDWALGGGRGIARGQFTMIYGPEGCGKTTISMLIALTTVANGGKVVVFDLEGRWNVEYAYKSGMGYPGKDYMLIRPDTQEDFFTYLVYFAEKGYDYALGDSVTALPPRIEAEDEDVEGGFKTVQARNWSTFFRMRMNKITLSKMAIVLVNQMRVGMTQYEPTVLPGGKALKHYVSGKLKLEKPDFADFEYEASISDGDRKKHFNPIGLTIDGVVDKNSICPPFRPVNLPIRFDNGLSINFGKEVCDYGKQYSVLTGKSGGRPGHWYYGERFLGTTQDEAEQAINGDPELRVELTRLIRQQMIGV